MKIITIVLIMLQLLIAQAGWASQPVCYITPYFANYQVFADNTKYGSSTSLQEMIELRNELVAEGLCVLARPMSCHIQPYWGRFELWTNNAPFGPKFDTFEGVRKFKKRLVENKICAAPKE